jgi:hypothetical protein
MLEELPEGFHKQEGLKYFVRRINGQVNPKYPTAPAIAWTHINTIEFMSGAFNQTDISYVQRLILHEKAHFLWEFTFEEQLRNDWIKVGDWFIDPTSASGWSTSNTTEFVSAYAHQKNPNEDMAESIASYVTNPDILRSRSMRKYEFIRDRIMHGTRYIAQIREDLTFMVYNLFPDLSYPGKVIGVTVDIKGKPYAEVHKRITAFRKLQPNGSIQTEIISNLNGVVVMKATIINEDGKVLGNVSKRSIKVGDRFKKNFDENLYGAEQQKASYKRQPQETIEVAGEGKTKGSLKSKQQGADKASSINKASKILNTLESTENKKTKIIAEEMNKMKNLIGYNRKTQ